MSRLTVKGLVSRPSASHLLARFAIEFLPQEWAPEPNFAEVPMGVIKVLTCLLISKRAVTARRDVVRGATYGSFGWALKLCSGPRIRFR